MSEAAVTRSELKDELGALEIRLREDAERRDARLHKDAERRDALLREVAERRDARMLDHVERIRLGLSEQNEKNFASGRSASSHDSRRMTPWLSVSMSVSSRWKNGSAILNGSKAEIV
jgi:hypothetical protein